MDNLSPAKLKRALLDVQQQHNFSQEVMLQLEKEILAGKAQQLLDFKHTPVDIETFLTDPYFLGGVTKDSWPKPIDSVIEIIEGKFNEVILTGSTGRSKNTRANWIVAYNLYYLSCLTKPAEYCNLLSDSKIVLVLMNRTDKSAKDVTFGKFYSLITSTPYFKDDYKWDNEFKTKLAFPSDNIEVIYTVASPNNSALGEDTILFLGDEFNFMEVTDKSKKAEGNVYNQARDTYNTLMARIKGRFLTDKYIPSTSVVTTSRSSDSDFTSWRLSQLESEGLKSGFERIDHSEGYSIGKTYVSDGNQWDFRPSVNEDGSIRYSGKKFYFAISDGKNPSEILESIDSESDTKGREILEVPEEYRKEFTDDPDKALADIAGRVSKGTGRYFASYMKHIYNATTDYTSKKFEPLFAEYDISVDTWDLDHGYPPINPKYVVLNQHVPRFCHIDLALTGDNAGISIGYSLHDMPVGEFNNTYDVERKPKIVYEACIGITPPREGQINFEMIRQMLYYLKEKIGVNLRYVSLDGFASQDMMQILEANLFEVKYISVSGKNSLSAYKSLRTAFGEGTITIPPNKLMLKEFRELVYDGKVIDHPMVSETGEEGSNDVVDAICGTHKNIMEYYHLGELYDFDNYEVLSLYG